MTDPAPIFVQGAARWLTWWLITGHPERATLDNIRARMGAFEEGWFTQAMQLAREGIERVQALAALPESGRLLDVLPAGADPSGYIDVRVGVTWAGAPAAHRTRTFIATLPVNITRGQMEARLWAAANEMESQWQRQSGDVFIGERSIEVMAPLPYPGE